MSAIEEGMVIKAQSGFFTVLTPAGKAVVTQLRGRLKKRWLDTDIVAVGDRVEFTQLADGSGMLEAIQPRQRALTRLEPIAHGRGSRRWDKQGFRREREEIIIANPDQVVFVLACAQPEPRLRMLDRLLVGADRQGIPALICANKLDLVTPRAAHQRFAVYEQIGYPVLYTSAVTGEGVPALNAALQGRLSALIGPSGVGKTSLLNRLQPGLGHRVQEVSHATGKGRHTTNVTELVPLAVGGWVADTPGIRALALFDLEPEEIDAHFPDIAPYVPHCDFSDCSHTVDPGCAVIAALEAGQIDDHRYESYVRLHIEHRKLADMYWWGIEESAGGQEIIDDQE